MTKEKKKPIHHRLAGHAVRAGQSVLVLSISAITVVIKQASPIGNFFGFIKKKIHALNEKIEDASPPRLSVKEQMFLIKRLAFLIRANVPILECLYMLSEQVSARRQVRVLKSVIKDVSNGTSLAKSLGRFPATFGDFAINIIKVGESSGTLSQNLNYLADELQKRHALQRKIAGAMVYPAVITIATFGITGFLMLYLFPKIIPVFSSLNMELPLATKIVMTISLFLQEWILFIALGAIVLVIVFTVLLRVNKQFHFWWDNVLLHTPVFGDVLRDYNLANAARTLGLLLKSGITLSEALPLTSDTTQNLVYKKEFRAVGEVVHRGERISTYMLKKTDLFPAVMGQMLAVGEKSGNLPETLVYLSDLYSMEVDEFTKNLSSLIEPALMVLMGIVVGFIAIAIITPIYGITQNLNPK